MKVRSTSWLKLILFSWLAALASSVALAAVLVGVTMAIGDTEPQRIPDQMSRDVVGPAQTTSGTIADADRVPSSK
jgi:hypothetical protein